MDRLRTAFLTLGFALAACGSGADGGQATRQATGPGLGETRAAPTASPAIVSGAAAATAAGYAAEKPPPVPRPVQFLISREVKKSPDEYLKNTRRTRLKYTTTFRVRQRDGEDNGILSGKVYDEAAFDPVQGSSPSNLTQVVSDGVATLTLTRTREIEKDQAYPQPPDWRLELVGFQRLDRATLGVLGGAAGVPTADFSIADLATGPPDIKQRPADCPTCGTFVTYRTRASISGGPRIELPVQLYFQIIETSGFDSGEESITNRSLAVGNGATPLLIQESKYIFGKDPVPGIPKYEFRSLGYLPLLPVEGVAEVPGKGSP